MSSFRKAGLSAPIFRRCRCRWYRRWAKKIADLDKDLTPVSYLAPDIRLSLSPDGKSILCWIDSAKRPETKARHLEEAARMLAAGEKVGMK